jgi:hypothetical protein
VVNGIEACLDVTFDHPTIRPAFTGCEAVADVANRVLRAAIWSETVGMSTKVRFPNGLKNHSERFLYNPILDVGDAQRACLNPTSWFDFVDVRSAHRSWLKPSFLQGFSKSLVVSLGVLLEVLHGHAVASRRSTPDVLLDVPRGGSDPILLMEPRIQVKEPKGFVLFCP